MKVGFIGLGRMGSAMARRLIEAGHDVGVYNRTPEKLKALIELGAKPVDSIKAAASYGEAVFTMLADDAAVMDVVSQAGRPGGVVAGRRHSHLRRHPQRRLHPDAKELHEEAGQIFITTPMLGRPEVVTSAQAGMVLGGAQEQVLITVGRCSTPSPGALSKPAPIRSPPPRSRSPIISCSAAPSRRWARALR